MTSNRFNWGEVRSALNEVESSLSTPRSKPLTRGSKTKNKHCKPIFKPRYLGKNARNKNAINAIIEIRELWKYVISEANYNYSIMYSKLTIPISDELKQTLQKHKEAFAVYDNKLNIWLVKSDEPRYEYCYNGEEFKKFNEPISQRLLLVGKYTILMQEPNLLRETKSAPSLFRSFVMPINKGLRIGVPGCGKTTHIIKNHSRGSLVLTSCAEGAQDIRSRMAKKKGGDPVDYRDSYRTIDSYLLNSRVKYSHVWMDEALMEHPGKMFLVCLFSHCSSLTLLGDPNQLGYINRVNGIKLRYDIASMFFKPTEILNKSYRCPVDVMAIISSKYDGGAYSASSVLRSLKSKYFTSLKDVPKSDDVKYLVFKQAEKKLLEKAGYNVSTVHEFQGKQAPHVVVVRMSRDLREPLYASAPHMLVAMSRHMESLVYYTPVHDELKALIDKQFTNAELRKHRM